MEGTAVKVTAWCGRCGQQFHLAELLAPPHAGRCPRCDEPFAAGYTAVVASAARSFTLAAQEMLAAGVRLKDVAPRLHIDAAGLGDGLRSALDH